MENKNSAHIRSAQAKIRFSKKLIHLCKKANDRNGFRVAIEVGAEGKRELAQRIDDVGVRI